MKTFLRRLIKFAAYTAAGVVILLAIAVGLFRLFLPRLPEYQDNIKSWASAAIGMEVEFSGMDARWGLSGPELAFYDTQLIREAAQTRVIAAEEVRVGIALTRLLLEGTPVVDLIVIRNTSVEIRQLDDGRWWIQGALADEWLGPQTGGKLGLSGAEVIGEDIEIVFLQPGDERPRFFGVPRATVSIDKQRLAVDARVRLPEDLGRELSVSATQRLTLPKDDREWDVIIEVEDVDLAGWSDLQRTEDRRVLSGTGDVDLSVAYAKGRIRSASAEVDFAGIALQEKVLFDLSGRFELNVTASGWLGAAEEFQVSTADHQWPEASLRAEVSTDDEGRFVLMDIRASYLDLQDASLIAPLLGPERQQQLAELAPNGIVQNLVATVSDIDSDSPRFDIAAELERAGVATVENRPGVRGFSGVVRANRLGGRVEVRSTDMIVDLPKYSSTPIDVDSAEGTIIWRSSDQSTTVLSDSIRIRNEVFDSQSSVQLIIDNEESSPEIDLTSAWSITDVSAMKKYLPEKIIKPKLNDWFNAALVRGSIPEGTTTLNGRLDEFPFDNGEGRFFLEASVRDTTFLYHPRWPAAEMPEMEIVLDKTRLYSVRNRSDNLGNQTVDAKIEIPDLRDPILTVEAFSTGTLETIRSFSRRSPIADVFGGQLKRISVSGPASLSLDLTIPLKDPKRFEFTSRITSNDGTLAIEGFEPQLTELNGEVTIVRDDISSSSLGARFLGREILVELATSTDPRFSVVANTRGSVSAEAIVEELGVPLDGLISGSTNYEARILFPRREQGVLSPFTIQIDSDLQGLGIGLPEPVGKPEQLPWQINGDIRFMPGGEKVESAGTAANGMAWQVVFNRLEAGWDFDRGVVTMGDDDMQPAETRGLHIRGNASTVRLEDWLSLSRSGDKEVGVAERIRSIDLLIADLFAVGQHLQGHHVRVDRSARDWLVQVEGEHIVGSVFVPYDFGSERAMVVEMERLHLPGDDESVDEPSPPDPTTLPPITLTAGDFALGDRHFGALEARVERVADGLEATTITTKDDTFEIMGTGKWVADELDPLGSRTSLTTTLTSNDVMRTMTRLNFTPGIDSDQMDAQVDLSWSGGPRADFLDVLDGEVQVQFGNGQLEEVEPGAGRVFGLMSIVALPRRLSFDFRDVFSKGFGFDKIAGTFRIVDGESYTCDLSLAGPAADIGIVGRASLANRDYQQTAVVSANVGNTLPIVGAVVAGPQAAAALLIFSQIFKKPLQEVGQFYYGISGSWDEPIVESSDAANFASNSDLAGCIASAE
jgi:uncharacterized protein (TIGR02099 family)